MFFQNLDFELWLEILRTFWQQLNESLNFSCFTIFLGNAILFMSTNQIKHDFDSLSPSITPHYFVNSKRKLDVQFSICGWRQLKLTGLSNPSLVYLVATVNGKLPLFSWQNSKKKISIWVSRFLLKRKACCKQGKYIILRVPQNKMGAWFGHLRSLGKVSRNRIYLKLITRQGSFPSSEKEDTVEKQYMLYMNIMWTADIQMKWRCDHRSCDCYWSNHNKFNKLTCSQRTGLHSAIGGALQR